MTISRFEFPNGRALCELINELNYPTIESESRFMYLRFSASRYFIEQTISIHNCYGDAEINGVTLKNINCPNFFRISSSPEFVIEIPLDKFELIEEKRQNGDISISLNLKVLFSLSSGGFYKNGDMYENNINLFAQIPKSNWIEKYLPTWNYYSITERIINLENINRYADISDLTIKCRKNFIEGRYDDVLREGFTLLEAIPSKIGYNDVKDMFIKLKEIDNEYMKIKYECIEKVYEGIKKFANLSRHVKTDESQVIQGHIGKADASFFLNILEILVNYIFSTIK